MPRRRDLPCSRCGKLLWRGRTSATVPVCRECRRESAHGTPNGYDRHGCRCAECTEAKRVQALAYRERRRAEGRPIKFGRVELRECEHCGVEFESRRGRRFCSIECVGASRRGEVSRRRGMRISREARLAVYERDGWLCHVCGEAVEPDAHYQSDWAPTLDHLVPVALGGSDAVENLATAHRWCNSVRGDLRHFTDGELLGV